MPCLFNRFSGFGRGQTAEAVLTVANAMSTQLKQGVNEMRVNSRVLAHRHPFKFDMRPAATQECEIARISSALVNNFTSSAMKIQTGVLGGLTHSLASLAGDVHAPAVVLETSSARLDRPTAVLETPAGVVEARTFDLGALTSDADGLTFDVDASTFDVDASTCDVFASTFDVDA